MAEEISNVVPGEEEERLELEDAELTLVSNSAASADPFAAAITHQAAIYSPEVAGDVSRYLQVQSHHVEEQSRHVKIQTKLLQDEHDLRLAHLRNQLREETVRRLGLRLRVSFQIFLACVVTAIGIASMFMVHDAFMSRSVVIDGVEASRIKEILEVDIASYEVYQRQAVRVWDSAGGYSPTIGILGAVLGLIQVMENLSDPSKLGAGIAVAFVATIYGVGLANLVFLPIAHKLKEQVGKDIERREMLADIFYSIASGENSRVIEERVTSYE